jgi:hypothetical protein
MTHRHDQGFSAATWQVAKSIGFEVLAAAIGTTPGWLRKFTNPETLHRISVDRALLADVAAARAGQGTPHFDEFHRQLIAAGALDCTGSASFALFARAARPALAEIRAAIDRILRWLDDRPGTALAA